MHTESSPPHQPFTSYVTYAYELGFELGPLVAVYDRLQDTERMPQHWQHVIEPGQETLDMSKLTEALHTTYEQGQAQRAGGHVRGYNLPHRLGTLGLVSLTIFADAHTGCEALPDPRIEDPAIMSQPKHSPKSAVGPYDIFTYAERLGFPRRLFIDHPLVAFWQERMETRLPEFPPYLSYSYDYEAISLGAHYPVVNGVAFRGYHEQAWQPLEAPHADIASTASISRWPLERSSRCVGLTPSALATDTYADVYKLGNRVTPSTLSALLKYIKALRQAGLHDVQPKIHNS